MKHILAFRMERQAHKIRDDAFMERIMNSSSGLRYTIYMKDSLEVLRNQLRHTRSEDLITETYRGDRISHPMNAHIGTMACTAARSFIQMSDYDAVIWREL